MKEYSATESEKKSALKGHLVLRKRNAPPTHLARFFFFKIQKTRVNIYCRRLLVYLQMESIFHHFKVRKKAFVWVLIDVPSPDAFWVLNCVEKKTFYICCEQKRSLYIERFKSRCTKRLKLKKNEPFNKLFS